MNRYIALTRSYFYDTVFAGFVGNKEMEVGIGHRSADFVIIQKVDGFLHIGCIVQNKTNEKIRNERRIFRLGTFAVQLQNTDHHTFFVHTVHGQVRQCPQQRVIGKINTVDINPTASCHGDGFVTVFGIGMHQDIFG